LKYTVPSTWELKRWYTKCVDVILSHGELNIFKYIILQSKVETKESKSAVLVMYSEIVQSQFTYSNSSSEIVSFYFRYENSKLYYNIKQNILP
jgi:hypothetical protein